jgi:hypothetical protein
VTQDVANNLGRSACVYLTRRMAVPEGMTTKDRHGDACTASILTNSMADRTGCKRAVGQRRSHENVPHKRPAGATSLDVSHQRSGDSWQKRQLEWHACLSPAHP